MLESLSKTEMTYVNHVVLGCKSRKQIADLINRSAETVSNQLKNIYRKLGINSVAELCKIFYTEIFDLKDQIEIYKKEIGKTLLLFSLMYISSIFEHQDFLRVRRTRKKGETEFAESADIPSSYIVTVHGK